MLREAKLPTQEETRQEAEQEESQAQAEISLQDAIRYAQRLHRGQQLEGAETLYRRILEIAPGHPDVLHFLGLARFQRGYPDEAVESLRAAISQQPGYPDFHSNLGNIYMSEGRIKEALASYRQALQLAPGRADFHNNLGALFRATGQLEAAQAQYQRAIELDPAHFRAYNNLGMLAAARGDAEAAVRYYCQSITLTPGHPDGHKLLGLAYYQLGRLEEAAAVFRDWLQVDPGNPMAQHHLAACSGQDVPARAADDYVEQTFDGFASSFEEQLQNRLSYRAPEHVATALRRCLPPPARQFDLLDLGCGTGLCGPLVAPWAANLTGVDLSVGMLNQAEAKGCYDRLYKIELTEFLLKPEQQGAWDLILSADTLCYFGPLGTVARAARGALRPGGLLAFSVEDAAGKAAPEGHLLNPHGRYAHTEGYLRRCLAQAHLDLLSIDSVTLRTEGGKPVPGWVIVGQRA
ncbi:tetratricopeptide repeat protein [Malikia sp.]|uniref:tetratricopeptide repeat protein n=1 Tax=Malikia sp. TaxID=2070706 RepID=UPI00261A0551|nr:tetratricopeptide repeat protein [Malikia sp.]MDD2730224.1 tetratricopeptide repeat protein [Malikia sp.]